MKTLPSIMAVVVLLSLSGCTGSKIERIVRIVDADQNRPATSQTFVFFEDPAFAPLVKVPGPVSVQLDANGEAHIALPRGRGWARLDEGLTNSYGVSLNPADIVSGGRFRLYGPPSNPNDTKVYPSKYVLEIKKPGKGSVPGSVPGTDPVLISDHLGLSLQRD